MTIRAEHLGVTLGARLVINDVTLGLNAGELTAIIGPNGAGKSTMMRAMAGLLPASSGRVLIGDKPLTQWDRTALARQIGFLPQQRVVHWPLSVERTVRLGRGPHDDAERANGRDAINQAMADMDVAHLRNRPVTMLSGGELARVLLARVLAQETAILFADEPTAGLDPAHQLSLLESFAKLARSGRTVAVAMHDLSLAARYCQRIILLFDGAILADGPPRAVIAPGHLKTAFGINARIVEIDDVPVVVPTGLC
jgi:iron complex transport system ATP-binding protein